MLTENLTQLVTISSNIINQNLPIILLLLTIAALIFSKRRGTLTATLALLVSAYLATLLLNLNWLATFEIALPFSIAMIFFASQTFYLLLITSIIIMISASSIQTLGAGVSIGIITPFVGETLINKIRELGWILNE